MTIENTGMGFLWTFFFSPKPLFKIYLFLHKDGTPPLSWHTRCKIAQGAANGISFLHENNHIHRDIKR